MFSDSYEPRARFYERDSEESGREGEWYCEQTSARERQKILLCVTRSTGDVGGTSESGKAWDREFRQKCAFQQFSRMEAFPSMRALISRPSFTVLMVSCPARMNGAWTFVSSSRQR